LRSNWCIIAEINHAPKDNKRTRVKGICFLKQKNAVKKKRILGKIPQRAPFAKFCIICGFPLFSKYIHIKTNAPVRGITPISPAVDGHFFPRAVAISMMHTLRTALRKICIIFYQFLSAYKIKPAF
jgi:hypothetical protein